MPGGDKGVLSAYQSLYEDKRKQKPESFLYSDPRYYNYQLVLNAFISTPIAKAISIPMDLIAKPLRDIRTTLGLILRDKSCRREVIMLSKSTISHSAFKHVVLLYSYELTKVFISNEKGINVFYGPVTVFLNGSLAASTSVFLTHLYKTTIHQRVHLHPDISLHSLRPFQPNTEIGIFRKFSDAPLEMMRNGILYGTFFMVYERLLQEWDPAKVSWKENVASAYIASYFALTAVQPFEVLKNSFKSTDITHWDTFRRVVSTKGIVPLWRGSFSSCVRGSPFFAFLFGSYDSIKRICLWVNGYTLTPEFDIPKPGIAQDKPIPL